MSKIIDVKLLNWRPKNFITSHLFDVWFVCRQTFWTSDTFGVCSAPSHCGLPNGKIEYWSTCDRSPLNEVSSMKGLTFSDAKNFLTSKMFDVKKFWRPKFTKSKHFCHKKRLTSNIFRRQTKLTSKISDVEFAVNVKHFWRQTFLTSNIFSVRNRRITNCQSRVRVAGVQLMKSTRCKDQRFPPTMVGPVNEVKLVKGPTFSFKIDCTVVVIWLFFANQFRYQSIWEAFKIPDVFALQPFNRCYLHFLQQV